MNIFFTSDTHLGHKNVLKHSNRPFPTIEEHDQTLISNWNSVVEKEDIVYFYGNLPDDPKSQSFDVGVDCHDYTPISYAQVKEIMSRKEWTPPDYLKQRESE